MDKSVLTGHTALCLVTLIGFFVYTSSYSLVYHVFKTGSTVKPVAVLELWMVFVHLITAAFTCALYAVLNIQCADIQTSIFLGVALSVTVCSVDCINTTTDCIIYFPAAAWAPLAASGAIAWSWIVYIASLGCQATSVTLGTSTSHLISPIILALIPPSIAATLKQTCGLGAQPFLSIGLHITMLLLAFVIWNISHFVETLSSRIIMRILAGILVIVDAFITMQAGIATWICLILVVIALSDGQIFMILFGSTSPLSLIPTNNNKTHNTSKGGGGSIIKTTNSIPMKKQLHRQ